MQFLDIDRNSVVFEFDYKNFEISIADYIGKDQGILRFGGKLSVLVTRYTRELSHDTVIKIAEYIGFRIRGNVLATGPLLDINVFEGDQFMATLMAALDVIIPF